MANRVTIANMSPEFGSTCAVFPIDAQTTRRQVEVSADGTAFSARVRLDTSREADHYRHGGVLPYVLRTVTRAPGRRDGPGGLGPPPG